MEKLSFKGVEDIADGRSFDELVDLYLHGSQAQASGSATEAAAAEMEHVLDPSQAERLDSWFESAIPRPILLREQAEKEGDLTQAEQLRQALHRLERGRATPLSGATSAATSSAAPASAQSQASAFSLTCPVSQDPLSMGLPIPTFTASELKSDVPTTVAFWCPLKDAHNLRLSCERNVLAACGRKMIFIEKITVHPAHKDWAPESEQARRRRLQGLSKVGIRISNNRWLVSDCCKRPETTITPGSIVCTWDTGNAPLVMHAISLEKQAIYVWLLPIPDGVAPPADYKKAVLPPASRRQERTRMGDRQGFTVVLATYITWKSDAYAVPISRAAQETAKKNRVRIPPTRRDAQAQGRGQESWP